MGTPMIHLQVDPPSNLKLHHSVGRCPGCPRAYNSRVYRRGVFGIALPFLLERASTVSGGSLLLAEAIGGTDRLP